MSFIALFFISVITRAETNIPASQAIYVYNFMRYIMWPDKSIGNNFIITVYGNSPVYKELIEYTKNRKFGSKSIVIYKTNNLSDLNGSHIVFVSDDKSSHLQNIKQELKQSPTLIIGEREGSLNAGATIEILFRNNTLIFNVSETAAKEHQLVVSRELLKMAY